MTSAPKAADSDMRAPATLLAAAGGGKPIPNEPTGSDAALARDWLARWEKNILADTRSRYCNREIGEEIGWLTSPFRNGFHDGYQATQEVKWVQQLADWADSWIKRGVKEPDGFAGWGTLQIGGTALAAELDAKWHGAPGPVVGIEKHGCIR